MMGATNADGGRRRKRVGGNKLGRTRVTQSVTMSAVRRLAEERHLTTAELVARALQIGDDSRYPTALCLLPSEVEVYAAGHRLPQTVLEHVAECSSCTSLLEMAKPAEAYEKFFLEQVRQTSLEPRIEPERTGPLKKLLTFLKKRARSEPPTVIA
jgi:hypothetical protein